MLKESEPGPPLMRAAGFDFMNILRKVINKFNTACSAGFWAKISPKVTFSKAFIWWVSRWEVSHFWWIRRKPVGWIISDASFIMLVSKVPLSFWISSSALISLFWPWFSSPLPSSFIFHAPCCFPLIWLPASFRSPSPRSKAIKQSQIPLVPLQDSTCGVRIWLMSLLDPWLYISTGHRVPFDPLGAVGYFSRSLTRCHLPDGWCSVRACSGPFHFFLHVISLSSFLLVIAFLSAVSLSACRCNRLFIR